MTRLRPLFLAIVLIAGLRAAGYSHYATHHNGFASVLAGTTVGRHQSVTPHNQRLVAVNGSTRPLLVLESAHIDAPAYRFMVRVANKHNKPGRSYAATAPGGNRVKVSPTACGLVFNMADTSDYWTVTMACANSHLYDDVMDRRTMTVAASHMVDGRAVETHESLIEMGMNLSDGLNTLAVEVKGNEATIMAGDKELTTVMTVDASRTAATVRVGGWVGPACEAEFERMVTAYITDGHVNTDTPWTRATLDEHFATSTDPLEGYWHYLDRDMEDKWLRLGGRYTLALVAVGDGYDIIYVDGAQTKRGQWTAGKLKGHLRKTAFIDNYEAVWIDATFMPINEDVYATFDNGVILTLRFPVYKSQVRFAKVIEP